MSKLKAKWADFVISGSDVFNQIPTGVVDGVNDTFTLSFTPIYIIRLEQNGRPLRVTTDYTLSGTTLTLVVPPAFGQELDITYTK